jgi:hypothetical protein
MLKVIKKQIHLDQVKGALANPRRMPGYSPHELHHRLPGETRESVERTIDFAITWTDVVQFSIFTPFPVRVLDYLDPAVKTDSILRSSTGTGPTFLTTLNMQRSTSSKYNRRNTRPLTQERKRYARDHEVLYCFPKPITRTTTDTTTSVIAHRTGPQHRRTSISSA